MHSLVFQLMKLANIFFFSLGKERIQLYGNGSGFTESSYFSQILKADMDNIKFLRGLYFVTIYG